MALRLDHVEVTAHDPARLAQAYQAAGLEIGEAEGEVTIEGGRGRVLLRRTKAAPLPDHLRACDPGIAHFCIQSTRPNAAWQDLAANGMAWNAELLGLGTGYTYAYGYDVEGNLVELEGTGEARDGRDTWLAHVAIVTPDIDAAGDFYTRLLGVESHAQGRFSHRNMGRIAALENVEARGMWFDTDRLSLELWQYVSPPTGARSPERPTGFRRLGLIADDLAGERERLRTAGIELRSGADGALLGQDPEGNAFRVLASNAFR